MEPVPQPLLKPTATLREVGQAFVDHTNEFFYVSDDGQTLEGVVTITDLIRARDATQDGRTAALGLHDQESRLRLLRGRLRGGRDGH